MTTAANQTKPQRVASWDSAQATCEPCPAPFAIGQRLSYHGIEFAICGPDGDWYLPDTWPKVRKGDTAVVTRAERGWAERDEDGEWSVMHDWNVVRFANGIERAVDIASEADWQRLG